MKKYKQVKSEIEHESIENAEKFLGLIKVDKALFESMIVAAIIAGLTSGA